jgi:hypothetical protein
MTAAEHQTHLENEIAQAEKDLAALVLAFIAWQAEALLTLGKILDADLSDQPRGS